MIIIKFSEYNKNVQHIENRLKDMSLAFQLKQEQDIPKVMFEDGNIRLEGLEKIDKELDKLQSELKEWWYCSC
jgi:hypothetical protein